MVTIGERIKSKRKQLGLTQTQIKKMTGISSGTMSDIENGNTLPATPSLIKLSQALGCSIDWMLTGVSPNSDIVFTSDIRESHLINYFQEMSTEDQDELLMIAKMKAEKVKRKRETKFSPSESNNISSKTT